MLQPEENVYRVGWTADVDNESESESEEELTESRELWTHVFHPDREPAPYSEVDDEQSIAQITPQVEVKVHTLISTRTSLSLTMWCLNE